jgi:hypothetical protein
MFPPRRLYVWIARRVGDRRVIFPHPVLLHQKLSVFSKESTIAAELPP